MRLFTYLLMLIAVLAVGCGEDTDTNTGNQVPIVKKAPFTDEAVEAMEHVNQRRTEEHQKALDTGDFSKLFEISDQILEDEVGFDTEYFYDEILVVYEEARGELHNEGKLTLADSDRYLKFRQDYYRKIVWDMETTGGEFLFEFLSAYDEIVTEYTRLSYQYPSLSDESLLAQLKKSAKEEKVEVQYPEGF